MARPKIAVVDDPLEGGARREAAKRSRPTAEVTSPEQPPAAGSEEGSNEETKTRRAPRSRGSTRSQSAPDLRNDALVAVFGRVPTTLARRLEGVVFELKADRKVSQQDIIAALLLRHIDPSDERSLSEIRAALDTYYDARDGRRTRPAYAD